MSDFPPVRAFDFSVGGFVGPMLTGLISAAPASTAWPLANLAIYVPIRVAQPCTVYKLAAGAGATAAGNFDIGLYDSEGNRLVSSGATAKGSSAEHVIDVTDTRIGPGTYYIAVAADSTDNYILHTTNVTAAHGKLMGMFEQTTAYTLPSSATFATFTRTAFPAVAAYLRGY
jgi:hypothetical protein